MRTFEDDLKKELNDPEAAAYFYNAQSESNKELFKCGVIDKIDITRDSNKTYRWRIK